MQLVNARFLTHAAGALYNLGKLATREISNAATSQELHSVKLMHRQYEN